MTALVRYEAARSALAEAHRIDEVKSIRDKAEAMAAYARQAKDTELIQYATEIKVRAERKCGEMLRESAERGERATPKTSQRRDLVESCDEVTPTLADLGITRDESSRYQKLANMPDDHFETAIDTAKATAGEVTTAFMLREAKRRGTQRKITATAKRQRAELDAVRERNDSSLTIHARNLIKILSGRDGVTEKERQHLQELHDAISNVLQGKAR